VLGTILDHSYTTEGDWSCVEKFGGGGDCAGQTSCYWRQHAPGNGNCYDSNFFYRWTYLSQGVCHQFAERAHKSMIDFATGMEKIFTDDEYMKVFDVPKGTDTFYVLAHSQEEQPGMRFLPEKGDVQPNLSVLPQPHPTAAIDNDSPPPPTSTDKFPKGGGTPTPAPPTAAPAGK
jgi:hypothetical protein